MPWLEAHGCRVQIGTRALRAARAGLEVAGPDGSPALIEADTIIDVSRYGANNDLLCALRGTLKDKSPELLTVGDARGGDPGYVLEAIYSGAQAGLRV
jgi:hypothetical protein